MRVPVLSDGVVALLVWEADDGDWYAASVTSDDEIRRFTTESPTTTGDDVRAGIVALAASPHQAGFLIADAATGERLGNIAASWDGDRVGHVSYWLVAAGRGRGLGTRALQLFAGWLFETVGLPELRLWARSDNTASRRLAERAGFVRDPGRDAVRADRGMTWHHVAYRRAAPSR